MKNLLKIDNVKKISNFSSEYVDGGFRYYFYNINDGEIAVPVELPMAERPYISTDIIDESDDFINGFKVVQTSNGEYAYVRKLGSRLLPFRYDVATNFNEYGFALVGKDGRISWIDKDFHYLNVNCDIVEEKHSDYSHFNFNGWQEVNDFSKGSIPLSKVCYNGGSTEFVAYFGTDGRVKTFWEYDGNIKGIIPKMFFHSGTTFDEKGQAMALDQAMENDYILFDKGYCISNKDLIKICREKGFMDSICEDAEKCLDKEKSRVLKK